MFDTKDEIKWDYGKLDEAQNRLPKDNLKDFDEVKMRESFNTSRWPKIRRALEIIIPIAAILIVILVL